LFILSCFSFYVQIGIVFPLNLLSCLSEHPLTWKRLPWISLYLVGWWILAEFSFPGCSWADFSLRKLRCAVHSTWVFGEQYVNQANPLSESTAWNYSEQDSHNSESNPGTWIHCSFIYIYDPWWNGSRFTSNYK
jgi:hypothetical protein